MTVLQSQQLRHGFACLTDLQAQIDAGFRHINQTCVTDGKFSSPKFNEYQQVCYELACCGAELEAATAMLNYADKAMVNDALCEQLSLAYCAENLRNTWQRLLAHSAKAGISADQLLGLMTSAPLKGFLAEHGNVSQYASIGARLLTRANTNLPSGLDEEKDMVRASFARFTEQVVMPQAEHIHRFDTDIPDDLIEAAAQMGCFGTCIPERYGGLMPDERNDSIGMLVVTEELSRGSLGAAGSLITRPEIAARALLYGGTEDQKNNWLPRLASGQTLAAIGITEPDYGSDVASLSMKATKVDGGWNLNGSKTWCTFAGKADILVIIARSDPDRSKAHHGLSMFLVEKPRFAGHEFTHQCSTGGQLTGKAISTIGYRGMHSFDLSFKDYFIPDPALVGGKAGLGRGFHLAMAGLSGGRIQTAARATGVMRAALERAITYAADRKVFGAPVGDYQLTQVKLGRMFAALTAARQFSYAVARKMDNGEGTEATQGTMEPSLVKLYSCRAAEWVTREAMQIHGGMGYAEESDVSRYFVDARVLSIFEGAEETLALKVIARELTKKSGEKN